jgi:steroid delta-isomerase-like uncharacterized protein
MSIESNKETLKRGVEALNRGDLQTWFDLHDATVVAHGLMSVEPLGLDGVKQFYSALWGAFPDAQVTGRDLVGEDDEVTIRFTLGGTHQGDFVGIPATGRSVAVDGISIYRFREGKIVERWTVVDALAMMQQLGAIPEMAQA